MHESFYATLSHDLIEVEEAADRFLGNEKEMLQEAVKNGDLKTVQFWFEENFCKKSLKAQVREWLFDENRAFNNMAVLEAFEEEFSEHFLEEEKELVMEVIVEMAIHRRISAETMVGLFKKKVNYELREFEDLLRRMVEAEFIQYKEELGIFIVQPFFTLSRRAESTLDCLQSNIPMVCEPKKVYRPKDPSKKVRNGYLSEFRSVFTSKVRAGEEHQDIAYDFLNGQNSNKYRINWTYYSEYGRNHIHFPDNKDHSDGEYLKICESAYRQHLKTHFLLSLYKILGIEDIYFLNVFDRRHRNYPVSYILNPQGTDPDKALLSFAPQELTEEGLVFFKIGIANDFNVKENGLDLDKQVFKVRLDYVEKHLKPLLKLSYGDFLKKVEELAEKADSPHCFVSKMLDFYKQAMDVRCGLKPTTGIIVHFDATCSGYQEIAVLFRDMDLAEMTNVLMVNGEVRHDLYTDLAYRCYEFGLSTKYERNYLKKGVWIPIAYGSVRCISENFSPEEGAIVRKVVNQLKGVVEAQKLMDDWNPNQLNYSYWLPDLVKVYKEVVDDEEYLMEFMGTRIVIHETVNVPVFRSCEYTPNVIHSADGFTAREIARALHFNPSWKNWLYGLFSDPSKWKYCEDEHGSRALMEKLLKMAKNFEFYSLRILYEANEFNIDLIPYDVFMYLFTSLADEPCQVTEIHDSFGVHPNYVEGLTYQYRRILRDLYRSRFIPAVRDYLRHNPEGFTKSSPYDPEVYKGIMNSKYNLC